MRNIEGRLRKIEAARSPGRWFTVFGRDEAEHDRQIAALKREGKASDGDNFVCLLRSGGGPVPEPFAWEHAA
jgi:hypothetical protein